jgi:hypothetical protein
MKVTVAKQIKIFFEGFCQVFNV